MLPSGDFIVVAQAIFYNNDSNPHYFYADLSYPENSKTISDVRSGRLASTLNVLPYSILMNCPVSSDSKKPVSFQLGSNDEEGSFLAEEIKITAVRASWLTTFLK